jgi:hypothetical protein
MMIGRNLTAPALTRASVDGQSPETLPVGEIDQQNAVFGDEAHEHDEADHQEHIDCAASEQQANQNTDQG